MSFVQKASTSNNHRLYYIKARTEDQEDAWYFVLIEPLKERAFEKLDYSKPYDVEDYGNVIESGFGKTAPKHIIDEMNEKYDCQFTE